VTPRVLLLCGSLQHRSANRAALDVVCARLSAAPVEVVEFGGLRAVEPFDADLDREPPPGAAAWREQAVAAHAAVIAAPEYAGSVAGSVKNALDWLVGAAGFYGKPVAVLSAGTTGGGFALQELERTLTWQGARVTGRLGIAAPRPKMDASGAFTDAATLASLDRLADDLLATLWP
jgi:NAD(P)H-dependent FMN reductase